MQGYNGTDGLNGINGSTGAQIFHHLAPYNLFIPFCALAHILAADFILAIACYAVIMNVRILGTLSPTLAQ